MVAGVLTAYRTLIRKLNRTAKQAGVSVGSSKPVTSADTFCVLAFNHLHLTPNGTAKMCCIAGEEISEGGVPLSLNRDTYEQIWNSNYMLSARRGMAKGERISACARCYHEEQMVGASRRTYMNDHWLPQIAKTPAEIAAAAEREEWRVASKPTFLQLNLGNLCNLACRMCTGEYSSRISSDPVQSKWVPDGFMDVGRWVGLKLHIGPRPLFGVKVSGFHDYDPHSHYPLRWTNGHGVMGFPRPREASLEKLALQLKGSRNGQPLQVLLNGTTLFKGEIGTEPKTLELDLSTYLTESDFRLELVSDSTKHTGLNLGVAVLDACVYREAPKRGVRVKNDRVFTRFEGEGGWWSQKDVLFGEILSEPTECRRIIFQGGEPLLIKEVEEILDFLIRNEAAQKVVVELTTNMTTVSDTVINKLQCFKSVDVGCSIDGIGAVLEYIRFPAKWSEVEPNIKRLLGLQNVHGVFNVAVQAYNLMAITEIYRYADNGQIDVAAHFLVGPDYLSVLVLPPTARRIAMERIQSYLDGERGSAPSSNNRASAEYLLHFLNQHCDTHHVDRVRQFMVFTNDMDISRHQSFLETYPELAQLFREDGLNWIDETRYAGAAHRSTT